MPSDEYLIPPRTLTREQRKRYASLEKCGECGQPAGEPCLDLRGLRALSGPYRHEVREPHRCRLRRPKLVRDKMPLLYPDGTYYVASAREYSQRLRQKIKEEAREFHVSTLPAEELEELVDLLEAVLARAADLGVDRDQLERMRLEKELRCGAFADRIVWDPNLDR